MDIVDRIFELVDKKYEEQKQFAYDLNLPPSIISEWRRRKSASFNRRISQIAELLNTSSEYLLTGKKEEPTVKDDWLTEEERLLVLAYRAASEDDRAVVDAALRKYKPTTSKKKAM